MTDIAPPVLLLSLVLAAPPPASAVGPAARTAAVGRLGAPRPSAALAADTVLRVGPVVPVGPADGAVVVEPHLAVHPEDPDRLVIAALTFTEVSPGPVVRAWWSDDGGRSWSPGDLDPERARGADPWLAWSHDGPLHLVHLPDRHWVSTDGGRAWRAAPALPGADEAPYDAPRAAVTPPGAPDPGALHVWAARSRRLDGGQRVGPVALARAAPGSDSPLRTVVEVLPGDLVYQTAGLAVLSDGRVVAGFHEIDRRGEYVDSPRLWVTSFPPGGEAPGVPALVREDFRADSPDLAVGTTPEGAEALYLSWTGLVDGAPDGTAGRAAVTRSDDGGRTWSEPTVVAPIPEGVYVPHHPMAATGRDGELVVTWQRPRTELGARCFQLHAALSLDGARSFAPPVPVAPEPACTDVPGNEVPVAPDPDGPSVARRFGDGGDYHGLVSLGEGAFQVAWSDARSGRYRLYTARLSVADGAP